MGKRIDEIPLATIAALESYSWPGNIRELQNLIEGAVILANDAVPPTLCLQLRRRRSPGLTLRGRLQKSSEE